jgi:hypothetical protein
MDMKTNKHQMNDTYTHQHGQGHQQDSMLEERRTFAGSAPPASAARTGCMSGCCGVLMRRAEVHAHTP